MKKSIARSVQAVLVVQILFSFPLSVLATDSGMVAASNTISQAKSIARTIEKFETRKSTSDSSVWRSLGALIFVVGGLFAANHWLRRRRAGLGVGSGQRKRMRMIERYSIDQKRSLLLIAVDDRELLLGVGTDHITNLMELPTEQDELDEIIKPHIEEESPVSRIISMVGGVS